MKLYLSSYRIPVLDKFVQLVGKPVEDISIALLPNAKDYYAPRAKAYKIKDILAYHESKGLQHTDVVDLLNHRNPMMLKQELSDYDAVWAVGGNTFCLRQEIRRSGLENILMELLEHGLVYGGDSAGAVVVGQSLHGIDSVDIPELSEEPIYDGLGLIDEVVLPHADNDFFAEANQAVRDQHQSANITELSDAQALIIDGASREIVTTDTPEL